MEYPTNRLKVKVVIPNEAMRCPAILDQNDDPCFIIMKRGNTTGLTIGHANDISSWTVQAQTRSVGVWSRVLMAG